MFSLSYWLSYPYSFEGKYLYLAAVILLFMLSLMSYLFYKKKKHDKILRKYIKALAPGFFWFGVVALVFSFLRYEEVYIFSSRIWVVIIFISFCVWIVPLSLSFKKNFVKDRAKQQAEKEKRKYFPKTKKK